MTYCTHEFGDEDLELFAALRRQIHGHPVDDDAVEAAERSRLRRSAYLGRQRGFAASRRDGAMAHGGATARGGAIARGGATARCGAIARCLARFAPDGVGYLGFFESRDDARAAAAVLGSAVDWLRDRGAHRVVGPMEGDPWHPYRFNLGPFDAPALPLEPQNPPYYPRLWRDCGFRGLEDFATFRVDDPDGLFKTLRPRLESAEARGLRFSPLDLHRFDAELRRVHRLSSHIFAGAPLYREIAEPEFLGLYAGLKPRLDPELILFAVDPQGHDVGMVFAYPDHTGSVPAVNVKTLGVVAGERRRSLGSALLGALYRALIQKSYRRVHHCLIRDGNPSQRLGGGYARVLRRYRLYTDRGVR